MSISANAVEGVSPTTWLLILDLSVMSDTYHFLRDPPPGFLPRVGVITVSGLAGLILARKGELFAEKEKRLIMARLALDGLYSIVHRLKSSHCKTCSPWKPSSIPPDAFVYVCGFRLSTQENSRSSGADNGWHGCVLPHVYCWSCEGSVGTLSKHGRYSETGPVLSLTATGPSSFSVGDRKKSVRCRFFGCLRTQIQTQRGRHCSWHKPEGI